MLIEIYADLVCPWCYIGKVRLEQALSNRPQARVDLRWLPFQLNPELPPEGVDRATYLTVKFGGVERARQLSASLEQAAEREGLSLRLDRIRRTPNTTQAHRLVRLADGFGQGTAMAGRLFKAYFEEGKDIGDLDALTDLAGEIGLSQEETRTYLEGDADRAAIRAADQTARQLGVQAVPCFVFDRRYALSGAQEWTAFLPMLDLARGNDPANRARS
ncbi:DsbA family oxidoreductase [Niveispirillum irakense]|uniref:DsbA family oxidoreductase n=1 Tax=Niveispirillum irakense TaxID=34011 RepID=UPI000427296A|nr:DsbA family oxidoreductase [Niveispirillum irakense]